MALRQALWDLAGKHARLPVWRLLGRLENRVPASSRVPAYGSLLDFPLNDEDAVRLLREYLSFGLRMIKVKVGGSDPHRDLRRLQLVAQNAGPDVTLIADANEAWDAPTCIARLRYFSEHGINLRYIEDPLPRQDLAGFRELRGQLPCPVAGHDYFDRLDQYREFIEAGVIDVVRAGQNLGIQRALAPLAHQRGLPIFYGNSIGELNVHAAAALPGTERIEYSHVAWSTLFQEPLRVQAGCLVAPEAPGFGLDPSADALRAYHCPKPTEPKRWPCPW
jgi:L-alanine-DL-glutamate epimerase-like enolase superfamily enzyme